MLENIRDIIYSDEHMKNSGDIMYLYSFKWKNAPTSQMSKHPDGPFDKDWVRRLNFVVVSEGVWSYGCTQIVCELLQL